MNKTRLKVLALAAPLCLSLALSTPTARAVEASAPELTVLDLSISPRFEHIMRISASLSISSLGRAECGGTYIIYDIYDGYDSRMTMTLQRYEDFDWVDVKEWSQDFTGAGGKMMNKGYYVTSGYRYRMTVTAEILDSDGSVLESVFVDSPIKEY